MNKFEMRLTFFGGFNQQRCYRFRIYLVFRYSILLCFTHNKQLRKVVRAQIRHLKVGNRRRKKNY